MSEGWLDEDLVGSIQDAVFAAAVAKHKGVKHKVLDDGVVMLVDNMGSEAAIVQAARVSYGKGTKTPSDDITLIRYLMEHRHTTPFEMVELKFLIRVPMDCWRQWIRHRMASVNEYSTRYSEAIDSQSKAGEWRAQATVNKQGSNGLVDRWAEGFLLKDSAGAYYECAADGKINVIDDGDLLKPRLATLDGLPEGIKIVGVRPPHYHGFLEYPAEGITPQEYLTDREFKFLAESTDIYQERLNFGVAKEVARKDLPLSTYTEAYWKIDLHNLIHFLGLRMDSHAQLEIRLVANQIGAIVKDLYPNVWEAFEDFRMNAISFAGDEIEYLKTGVKPKYWSPRRESTFNAKKARLGIA